VYCQAAGIGPIKGPNIVFFPDSRSTEEARDIQKMAGCHQSGKICEAFLQIHEK